MIIVALIVVGGISNGIERRRGSLCRDSCSFSRLPPYQMGSGAFAFYLAPTSVFDGKTCWNRAYFFTRLGMGAMITYGSYLLKMRTVKPQQP